MLESFSTELRRRAATLDAPATPAERDLHDSQDTTETT